MSLKQKSTQLLRYQNIGGNLVVVKTEQDRIPGGFDYTEGRFDFMSRETIELGSRHLPRVIDADLLGSIGFAVNSPLTVTAYQKVRRAERHKERGLDVS